MNSKIQYKFYNLRTNVYECDPRNNVYEFDPRNNVYECDPRNLLCFFTREKQEDKVERSSSKFLVGKKKETCSQFHKPFYAKLHQ